MECILDKGVKTNAVLLCGDKGTSSQILGHTDGDFARCLSTESSRRHPTCLLTVSQVVIDGLVESSL